MKAIAITTVLAAGSAAAVPSLENLRNHTLLSNDLKTGPLESIAHIATFDEVPIFGGEELRQQMLSAASPSDIDSLSTLFNTVTKVTKQAGCSAFNVAASSMGFLKSGRLGYGSFCEEIPNSSRLRATADEQALQ